MQFSLMLEAGRRLQEAGCGEAGVSTCMLEARWRSLNKRVEHEHSMCDRKRTLRSR